MDVQYLSLSLSSSLSLSLSYIYIYRDIHLLYTYTYLNAIHIIRVPIGNATGHFRRILRKGPPKQNI